MLPTSSRTLRRPRRLPSIHGTVLDSGRLELELGIDKVLGEGVLVACGFVQYCYGCKLFHT